VADNETWPAQLQQILDPRAEVIEVINAGVIGASSFQGLAFLYTRGLALKPDLLIATFGFNDWAAARLSDRQRAAVYQCRGFSGMLGVFLYGRTPGEVKVWCSGQQRENTWTTCLPLRNSARIMVFNSFS